MANWINEASGMSVLRPIAENQLKEKNQKTRIWSDDLGAWGFFIEDITMKDEFLLWCSVSPGDRITLNCKDVYTVVGVWRDEAIKEKPAWIYRMMGRNGRTVDVNVKEKELFLEASKYI
jgi:hypothetical protein